MLPEIIIDSFAGGGGASTGIEMALREMGVSDPQVDIAINHSGPALAMHAANHPLAQHLESDIWTIDPRSTTADRPVGLLWASPDCRHFSRTKGQTPISKKTRGLAWSVGHWAEQTLPRIIMLENVPEFETWGPLIIGPKGQEIPDPACSGETFRQWVARFKKLGYRVQWKKLRACDFGAPTSRERLYIIMRRDTGPIVWPEPTHGDPVSAAVLAGRLKPWINAVEIVEWDREAHSIFMSREDARVAGVHRPLVENTMSRLARGVKRFVLDAFEACRVELGGGSQGAVFMTAHYSSDTGSAATVPLRTITGVPKIEPIVCRLAQYPLTADQRAGADRVAEFLRAYGAHAGGDVVVGENVIVDIGMRGLTPRELARCQGFPHDYILAAPYEGGELGETEQKHKIGNSVCPPVATALVAANYRPQARGTTRPQQGWLFETEAA